MAAFIMSSYSYELLESLSLLEKGLVRIVCPDRLICRQCKEYCQTAACFGFFRGRRFLFCNLAPSSNGSGFLVLSQEMSGSNPAGVIMGR